MDNRGPNGHQMMVGNLPKTEYRCWKNRGSSLTRDNNANFHPRGVDFQPKHNCEILGQNFDMQSNKQTLKESKSTINFIKQVLNLQITKSNSNKPTWKQMTIQINWSNKNKAYAIHHIDTTKESRMCLPISRFELGLNGKLKTLSSNELQSTI